MADDIKNVFISHVHEVDLVRGRSVLLHRALPLDHVLRFLFRPLPLR